MGAQLRNVLTTWARDAYNAATTVVGPPQVTLSNVPAHAAIIPSTAFHELPASARKVSYVFNVDPGTDIVTGDYLLASVTITGNVAWPLDYPADPSNPGYGNTLWLVRYHQESSPGANAYRSLYVEKIILGGPTSPNG